MRYFMDCEFIENGETIDLISLGLAAGDGRTLYLQSVECQFGKASEWVWRNVFPHLVHFDMRGRRACCERIETIDSGLGRRTTSTCSNEVDNPCPWATRNEIGKKVLSFCSQEKYGEPEFWGYFADYDWVAFCQLWGAMIQLPKGFPMWCNDLKQWCFSLGNPELPKQNSSEHHALTDAVWNKQLFDFLKQAEGSKVM